MSGSAFWSVILPSEKTNLITTPSFELGTTGWSAYGPAGSGTVGTTSTVQRFGAYAGSIVTQSTSGTAGVRSPTFTTTTGVAYNISAYVLPNAAVSYLIGLGDSNGNNLVGSVEFTAPGAGGTWHRYNFAYTETAGATRALVVRKTQDPTGAANAFYLDGIQVEVGSLTTYFDGDQPGCQWLGAQHASQSTRDDQTRSGGSVVPLSSLGFTVNEATGIGMPPIQNTAQSYALTDGAQFQRSRAAERTFTLSTYFNGVGGGTALAGLHDARRAFLNAIKPDLVTPQQPIRFWYTGAGGTVQIDAVYDGGLEMGALDGFVENAAIRFVAYQPYWESTTQRGTALLPRVNLGSVNYIARRSPLGAWSTLGQTNGTTIQPTGAIPVAVRALAINPAGTVFIGGGFGTLAGTRAHHIGMYNPTTNLFGTLVGGTFAFDEGPILSFAQNPNGTLFIGGAFSTVAGTVGKGIARWTGAFGTLQGGTIAAPGFARALLYSPLGTLFLGGQFNTVAGTANSRNIAMWTGAFGTLGGTANNDVYALAWGLDNRLFLGGGFGIVGGTQGTAAAFWKDGRFGTMNSLQGVGGADRVLALGVAPDGRLYEGGDFLIAGDGSALRAAVWNGVQHSPLGAGLGGEAWAMTVDQDTGNITYGGAFQSAGSINTGANYANWNGYVWTLPDISFINSGLTSGTIYAMAQAPDKTLYIAGDFAGTTQAAAVGTIVNPGLAAVNPILRLRNSGASAARIYQLLNVTTGDGIYFNLSMLGGEVATLNLTPGVRSFTSNFRGNVFGAILPGSNIATFRLLPGTNYISFFADSGSVDATLYYTPRQWSADVGTAQA